MNVGPICAGCCLNPQWTNDPFQYFNPPNGYFNPNTLNTPIFITTANDLLGLTSEEKTLLQKLVESYNLYCSLDKRSEADNKEFVDALHRLQQLVALRVARRVDPEVWVQPE